MSDKITTAKNNEDGSWSFWFDLDAGNGVIGTTVVNVPASDPAMSISEAKAAAISSASAYKQQWLQQISVDNVTGDVTL